jgi:hypothetical protein
MKFFHSLLVLIDVVLPLAHDHSLLRLAPAMKGEDERHLLGNAVDDGGEVPLVEHLVTEDGALIERIAAHLAAVDVQRDCHQMLAGVSRRHVPQRRFPPA